MSTREELHRLHPREYADFTYVYPVLSRRSGGVSFGVNLNLDKACNFDCPYCQVDRTVPGRPQALDLARLRAEVSALLESVDADGVCRLPLFDALPDAQKMLRDIAISGDGESTMVPEFAAVCRLLAEVQAGREELAALPSAFKLVLITNATLLDRAGVRAGVDALLAQNGEVWAKLDAGTEEWYQRVNISRVSLDRIEANLIALGQDHPFKIQSFFCKVGARGWDEAETSAWLDRLGRIRAAGARIVEVQLYTLARRPAEAFIQPESPEFLSGIRDRVVGLGIPARVYGVAD
jgi:wyosine [tRNA(Phe)-imidazoG37] synthetase (radical SAM superfamily)